MISDLHSVLPSMSGFKPPPWSCWSGFATTVEQHLHCRPSWSHWVTGTKRTSHSYANDMLINHAKASERLHRYKHVHREVPTPEENQPLGGGGGKSKGGGREGRRRGRQEEEWVKRGGGWWVRRGERVKQGIWSNKNGGRGKIEDKEEEEEVGMKKCRRKMRRKEMRKDR